ncbi:MAG: aldehyde dehydrogenase family protein [Bacillota bacterium]|nr:aldehyde dehydrogenase family protein [Thermoanaerobacteraceae bacterium]
MDTISLDQSIQALQKHKHEWATLPVRRKMDLLLQMRKRLDELSNAWVEASVRGKQIDPESPWVGEEWGSGPWTLAESINGYLETLRTLSKGHLPKPKKVTVRANGQVVAQVFPSNIFDRLILNGITAEVWMQPGVTKTNLSEHMAAFYKRKNPEGKVALVLGAGNVSSIPPLDVLHRLYVLGHVVILKMSPVNDYLGPILEDIFAPYVQGGYLRFAYGGAEVGNFLARHNGVEEIHLTGSARTHDLILYGSGTEGAERKRQNEPVLNKPITSELGGVSPTIIVPGKWSKADICYQAEHVVTMKLNNGGFNCVASQVLILPETWDQRREFMDAVRQLMRELPPRVAYYPGAAERQKAAVAAYPNAELLGGGEVPRTLITDVDPNGEEEYCFKTEFFGPVYAQTSLPGKDTAEYLRNAVRFCNEKLQGTLGAAIIVHPGSMKELGPVLDEAVADLRYGVVGVNILINMAFSIPQATWGAYPGHTYSDIQSGIGVVHNSLLFDKPEKTVIHGPFYPFPRSWLHGCFSLLPKPPWFVTNRTAHVTLRRATECIINRDYRCLPSIFVSALKG